MRQIIYFLSFFIIGFSASNLKAQTSDLALGKIHDSLKVKGSNNETFALYLPSSFNPEALSAIVFIFEPAARGKIGISPFIKSAEQYNYILVCSNNSRNGSYDVNFEIANRLFEEVFSRFKIDQRQIYTAGFSGGARLASAIAVLTKQMQGVIACGAGFSTYPEHIPAQESYSYAGLVGTTDFNHLEMTNNVGYYRQNGITNELFYFEGAHRWPPEDQLLRAFDWLELQAYKKRIRDKNPAVIAQAYQRNYAIADSLKKADAAYLAVFEFERIKRSFGAVLNVDSIQPTITALKKTKQFSEAIKIKRKIVNEETSWRNKFQERFNEELVLTRSSDNYKWWKKQLALLNKDYTNAKAPLLQQTGTRINSYLYALAIEASGNYQSFGNYRKALYCNLLLSIQFPEQPYAYYRAAINYAQLKKEKKLIEYLEKAMTLGYPNKEQVKRTREFIPFIETEDFKNLMTRY